MTDVSDTLKKAQQQLSSTLFDGEGNTDNKASSKSANKDNDIPFSPKDNGNTFPTEASDVKSGAEPTEEQLFDEMMNGSDPDFEDDDGDDAPDDDDFEKSEFDSKNDDFSEIKENSNFDDSELSKTSAKEETPQEQQTTENTETTNETKETENNESISSTQTLHFKDELNTVLQNVTDPQQKPPETQQIPLSEEIKETIEKQPESQQQTTEEQPKAEVAEEKNETQTEENNENQPDPAHTSFKSTLQNMLMGNDGKLGKDEENTESKEIQESQQENEENPPPEEELKAEEEDNIDTNAEEEMDLEEDIPSGDMEDDIEKEMNEEEVNNIMSSNDHSDAENKNNQIEDEENHEEQPENKENDEEQPKEEEQQENNEENKQSPKPRIQRIEGMTVTDTGRMSRLTNDVSVTARDLPLLQTNPDIETRCKNFLHQYRKTKKFPETVDADFRVQFSQYLNREKVNCVAQEKYAEAHELQEIAIKFSKNEKNFIGNEAIDAKIGQLEDRIVELDKQIQQLEKEKDKKMKKSNKDSIEENRKLKLRQQQDIVEFKRHWDDMDHLKKFTKPSPVLLNMTYKEKSTVSGKMFDRAEEFKKMVSQKEKEESAYAQERAISAMKLDRKKLEQKHLNEKRHIESQRQLIDSHIVNDYLRDLKTLNLRKERLIREIDGLKTLKLKGILPPLAKASTRSMKKLKGEDMTITPRTVSRFSLCKSTVHQPKVTVRPLSSISGRKTARSTK